MFPAAVERRFNQVVFLSNAFVLDGPFFTGTGVKITIPRLFAQFLLKVANLRGISRLVYYSYAKCRFGSFFPRAYQKRMLGCFGHGCLMARGGGKEGGTRALDLL